MRDIFAEDADMLSRLERPEPGPEIVCSAESPEEDHPPACDTDSQEKPSLEMILESSQMNPGAPSPGDALRKSRRQIAEAMLTMREFDWSVPEETSGSALRDEAADSFRKLYKIVAQLKNIVERKPASEASEFFMRAESCSSLSFDTASSNSSFGEITPAKAGEIDTALNDFSPHWPDLLRFLESIKAARRHLAGQVEFVINTLPQLCETFRLLVGASQLDSISEGQTSKTDDFDEETLSQQAGYVHMKQAVASGEKIQWMWAESAALPLPGFNLLARLDPLKIRWSEALEPQQLSEDLQQQRSWRNPVRIYAVVSKCAVEFPDCYAALKWVRAQMP